MQRDPKPVIIAILGTVLAVLLVILFTTGDDTDYAHDPEALADLLAEGTATTAATSQSDSYAVGYMVTGTARRATLTIKNGSGGTEQIDVLTPWTSTFVADAGAFVYVSAQNASDLGAITCTITIDGVPAQSATSDADYGIATCSGRV